MADITMCSGEGCTIKDTCYRHTAKPSEYRQSYFCTPPLRKKLDGTDCDRYWSTKDG